MNQEENAYLRPHGLRLEWGNFDRLFSLMELNLMTYYLLVSFMVFLFGFLVTLLGIVCSLVC